MGIVESRMRRLPVRSMMTKATTVQMKLAIAIDREVKVGEEKPMAEKIVAEKYIREF